MSTKRRVLIWAVAAVGATGLLASVLVWQEDVARTRWSIFMVGDPSVGAQLFFERDGCARCHSVDGAGGKLAPDLGYARTPRSSLSELVSAMWNHAPRMWKRMAQEKIPYPDLCDREMANLFAFLYTSRYMDEPGDELRGQQLFATRGCVRCHSVRGVGGDIGPDLGKVSGIATPIRWAQAMWNHAPAMEAGVKKLGMAWPKFQGGEMNDVLAYIRWVSGGVRRERELLPANPDRGWEVFKTKSCIACHAVKGQGGHVGPELGPGRQIPMTLAEFGGLMWNHSPEMWRSAAARNIPRPSFKGQEIADLIAFLLSLHYFEPMGSPAMGKTLFAERGCSGCHGSEARGGRGPALRGRGRPTTEITLATALWDHGPKMYRRAREAGRPWPTLNEGDIGDVVAFLNSPLKEGR